MFLENIISNYDIYNHILSYSHIFDICELICVNRQLYDSIEGIYISEMKVHGFCIYDLSYWLRRHNITRIITLEIYDYNVENDHCMMYYNEHCTCVEEIMGTFRLLDIKNLKIIDNVDLCGYTLWDKKL